MGITISKNCVGEVPKGGHQISIIREIRRKKMQRKRRNKLLNAANKSLPLYRLTNKSIIYHLMIDLEKVDKTKTILNS